MTGTRIFNFMSVRPAAVAFIAVAVLVLLGAQAPLGAGETVRFTSAVLPPSAFKQRQAKAQGKALKQAPGLALWGQLGKPVKTPTDSLEFPRIAQAVERPGVNSSRYCFRGSKYSACLAKGGQSTVGHCEL